MNYTTLENLKTFLNISDNSQDVLLNKLIERVTAKFDSFLDRNLETETYVFYEELNRNKDVYLQFPFKDINNVSVKKDDSNWEEIPLSLLSKWYVLKFKDYPYTWIVCVSYTSWFDTLNEIQDVEQACLNEISKIYLSSGENINNSLVKSEKIEWLSITYQTNEEKSVNSNSFDYKEVLRKYASFKPKNF